jgi:hypothetical protein
MNTLKNKPMTLEEIFCSKKPYILTRVSKFQDGRVLTTAVRFKTFVDAQQAVLDLLYIAEEVRRVRPEYSFTIEYSPE